MTALRLAALLLVASSCTQKSEGPSGAAAVAKAGQAQGKVEQVGAADFKRLAEEKGGLYLDVRTPGEVARGHLPNASVIDINDPRFEQKLAVMQKDKPIFVYCASGARSSAAAELMSRMGFKEIYNLLGGIGAWGGAGFPIERSAEPQPSGEGALKPDAFDLALGTESRVLVDFHTPWCAPCKRLSPIVDAVTEAWKGKVKVLKVDIDQSEALAQREKVQGVPVLVLYVDGKERWRHSGDATRELIEAELAKP